MAQFQGQTYIRPQVVSVVDDSRLVGPNDATGVNLAIVGVATGGVPTSALTFTSARDARRVLRGGELLDAVERAYAPGSNIAGAYRIVAVRVNAATRATLTLNDASAASAVVLTSQDYGLHTNQMSVGIAAGTTSGTKITVQKAGTATIPPVLVIQDNVGRAAIQIRYGADFTGTAISGVTGTAAVLNVTYTAGATPTALLTTTITGQVPDNLSLDLYTYSTLQQVVDQINAQGHYTAAVVGPDSTASSLTLDSVSGMTIFGANGTLRADLQAQLDFFNTLGELITAAKGTNATKPATTTPTKYFAGGSEGATPSNSSWQSAFDVLQSQDIQLVVPVTGDATLHAMANTHCQMMSSAQYKRERVCIVGGPAGETVTQAKTRAQNLNSDRAQLIYPGLLDYSTDGLGTQVSIPPYLVAAQKAGITAALAVANSATNKSIGARGVELILKPSEIDDLVYNGVTVVENVPQRGFRIVQDILTWQADQRYTRREFSTKLALDVVARTLRAALETRIGSVNGPGLQNIVRGDVSAVLDRLAQMNILVGGPSNPAYSNLDVGVTGDQVRVSVQVSIAVPANFFFISIFPTVFSSPLPAAS
jgi:hypothetical protein